MKVAYTNKERKKIKALSIYKENVKRARVIMFMNGSPNSGYGEPSFFTGGNIGRRSRVIMFASGNTNSGYVESPSELVGNENVGLEINNLITKPGPTVMVDIKNDKPKNSDKDTNSQLSVNKDTILDNKVSALEDVSTQMEQEVFETTGYLTLLNNSFNLQVAKSPTIVNGKIETGTNGKISYKNYYSQSFYNSKNEHITAINENTCTNISETVDLTLFTNNILDSTLTHYGLEDVDPRYTNLLATTADYKVNENNDAQLSLSLDERLKLSHLKLNTSSRTASLTYSASSNIEDHMGLIQRVAEMLSDHNVVQCVEGTKLFPVDENRFKPIRVIQIDTRPDKINKLIDDKKDEQNVIFSIFGKHRGATLTAYAASCVLSPILLTNSLNQIRYFSSYNTVNSSDNITIYTDDEVAVNNMIQSYRVNNPFLELSNVLDLADYVSSSIGDENFINAVKECQVSIFAGIHFNQEVSYQEGVVVHGSLSHIKVNHADTIDSLKYVQFIGPQNLTDNIYKGEIIKSWLVYLYIEDFNKGLNNMSLLDDIAIVEAKNRTDEVFTLAQNNKDTYIGLNRIAGVKQIFGYLSAIGPGIENYLTNGVIKKDPNENVCLYVFKSPYSMISMFSYKGNKYIKGGISELSRGRKEISYKMVDESRIIIDSKEIYQLAYLFYTMVASNNTSIFSINSSLICGVIDDTSELIASKIFKKVAGLKFKYRMEYIRTEFKDVGGQSNYLNLPNIVNIPPVNVNNPMENVLFGNGTNWKKNFISTEFDFNYYQNRDFYNDDFFSYDSSSSSALLKAIVNNKNGVVGVGEDGISCAYDVLEYLNYYTYGKTKNTKMVSKYSNNEQLITNRKQMVNRIDIRMNMVTFLDLCQEMGFSFLLFSITARTARDGSIIRSIVPNIHRIGPGKPVSIVVADYINGHIDIFDDFSFDKVLSELIDDLIKDIKINNLLGKLNYNDRTDMGKL